MTGPDLATWATVVGTWILIVGTLTFAYWQMRQNQRISSAQSILDLRERFDSAPMRAARRELSAGLLKDPSSVEFTNYDVGFFFQLVGSMTRARVLDRRMVWNAFGPWVTGYYYSFTHPVDRIAQWRAESSDPLVFADFEWLAGEIAKLDRTAVRGRAGPDRSKQDAQDMVESESTLSARG